MCLASRLFINKDEKRDSTDQMQRIHVGRDVPRAILLPLARVDARLGTPLARVSPCLIF